MSDFLFEASLRRQRWCRRAAPACLGSLLGWASPAPAQVELVGVSCPQLDREQSAEIEARLRAALLTTETQATVVVICEPDRAGVRITLPNGESALETLPMSANLREDLLEALDRGLEKLAQPPSGAEAQAARPDTEPIESAPPPKPQVEVPPRPRPQPAPPPTPERPSHPFSRAPSAPLFANAIGELWSLRPAWGAELGSEWALGGLRYGVRAGALTPTKAEPTFRLLDWEGMLHVAGLPNTRLGVQLTLGLGMSWMVVSPRGAALSHENSVIGEGFAFVGASRAWRSRHFALVPELGLRLFASQRGVRVDQRERASYGWFVPRVALGIAYLD